MGLFVLAFGAFGLPGFVWVTMHGEAGRKECCLLLFVFVVFVLVWFDFDTQRVAQVAQVLHSIDIRSRTAQTTESAHKEHSGCCCAWGGVGSVRKGV